MGMGRSNLETSSLVASQESKYDENVPLCIGSGRLFKLDKFGKAGNGQNDSAKDPSFDPHRLCQCTHRSSPERLREPRGSTRRVFLINYQISLIESSWSFEERPRRDSQHLRGARLASGRRFHLRVLPISGARPALLGSVDPVQHRTSV